MESVHGVDVSWMSKHSSHRAAGKDHSHRPHKSRSTSSLSDKNSDAVQNEDATNEIVAKPASPKSIPARPSYSRSASTDRTTTATSGASSPNSRSPNSRRNSWLSSISAKFSSPGAQPSQLSPDSSSFNPPSTISEASEPSSVPTGPSAPKNALLPHAVRASGDEPYIPAPPRSSQGGFLQSALRRLSSSSGQTPPAIKGPQHGLCERRVLNVDKNRERCHIVELDQSKLRRVAFCVDVEIASGPKYIDEEEPDVERRVEKRTNTKIKERNEGQTLKNANSLKPEEDVDSAAKRPEASPIESKSESTDTGIHGQASHNEKDNTKKKEKKKRSEEERKARKEKKRKLAEANGTVPVELVRNASDSSLEPTTISKHQASPTTDPVRIYRRCCQLRESPILKKITEQVGVQSSQYPGVVYKVDLTGYWLQLPDLITLSDYLAVVPVKELIMENCGLTDEGVRVILAGLLAAKCPTRSQRGLQKQKCGEVSQGGFVERVVLKNNAQIGRDGWRYICTFLAMCRSIKFMDLSKVPFPQTMSPAAHGLAKVATGTSIVSSSSPDISHLLGKAIGDRLAGKELELLNLAECNLSTEHLGNLIDGVIKSGLRRLGIAGNNITHEGMQHVARYVSEGRCEGLDLGGNDVKDQLGVIIGALTEDSPLYALSLANCNLTPDLLSSLFPALAKLSNFRFIDLSQNHGLFNAEPSALQLLRRYLPKLPTLKRIHLTDVSMTSEQAIALAEILPESPNLAHVNIMENPGLVALARAKDEANQEEACALYASLMAAVRVSQTIICIDIEVPSSESSEIVKALAKQVVAYCLWNMERGPVAEISAAAAALSEPHGGEKEVAVPDVLLHLVGHVEGLQENHDDEPAPDEDYVIGGTGVVKALGICLRNKVNDSRRTSSDRTGHEDGNGSVTPKPHVSSGKAKDMSKNLLGSARKIRARLQPALVKEARSGDRNNYQRLLFLDQTLEGMIKRFEDEYPETRISEPLNSPAIPDLTNALSSIHATDGHTPDSYPDATPLHEAFALSDDEDSSIRPPLSRHNSDVSLAGRALAEEEGQIHRFGQKFRRDILKPEMEDHLHGTTGKEDSPRHLQMLRAMLEGLGGEEIKEQLMRQGSEAFLADLSNEASALRKELQEQDPEAWEKFRESQEKAAGNGKLQDSDRNASAVE